MAVTAAVRQCTRRTICRIGQTTCIGLIDEPTTLPKRGVKTRWFSSLNRTIGRSAGRLRSRYRAAYTPAKPPPTITMARLEGSIGGQGAGVGQFNRSYRTY